MSATSMSRYTKAAYLWLHPKNPTEKRIIFMQQRIKPTGSSCNCQHVRRYFIELAHISVPSDPEMERGLDFQIFMIGFS